MSELRKTLKYAKDQEEQEIAAIKRLLATPDGDVLSRILLRDVLMARRTPQSEDVAMFYMGRNDLALEILGMADDG